MMSNDFLLLGTVFQFVLTSAIAAILAVVIHGPTTRRRLQLQLQQWMLALIDGVAWFVPHPTRPVATRTTPPELHVKSLPELLHDDDDENDHQGSVRRGSLPLNYPPQTKATNYKHATHLDPAFPDDRRYPSDWLVFDPTLGVVQKTVADQQQCSGNTTKLSLSSSESNAAAKAAAPKTADPPKLPSSPEPLRPPNYASERRPPASCNSSSTTTTMQSTHSMDGMPNAASASRYAVAVS